MGGPSSLVVKVDPCFMAGQGPGHSKWSRRLWRIIYGRFCDACVVLWFNGGKVKSEAEWIQFPNFTMCTHKFLYWDNYRCPQLLFIDFILCKSELLLEQTHEKPTLGHTQEVFKLTFFKFTQQTFSTVTRTVYDISVYDEQTHISMEITPEMKR